ncbi:hypothetical protein TNCV_1262401 [Trichonephila clavipes]|nr:hypothetical protein TNCV_1262401 [Trichonephila clavipes]
MSVTRRDIDSTSFWKRSKRMTSQILAKAVHNSVRCPIYDRKVRRMLIQPASSQSGLVRGTVVLLENSITMRNSINGWSSNLTCRIHDFMSLSPYSEPPVGVKQSESRLITPCYTFPPLGSLCSFA